LRAKANSCFLDLPAIDGNRRGSDARKETTSAKVEPTVICPPAQFVARKNAAQYLEAKYGFPCAPSWLAKLACVGGGPAYRKFGAKPLYEIVALDEWALARMSPPVHSTAEFGRAA